MTHPKRTQAMRDAAEVENDRAASAYFLEERTAAVDALALIEMQMHSMNSMLKSARAHIMNLWRVDDGTPQGEEIAVTMTRINAVEWMMRHLATDIFNARHETMELDA